MVQASLQLPQSLQNHKMRRNIRPLLTFILGWPLSIFAIIFLVKSFLSRSNGFTLDLTHVHYSFILLSLILFAGYFFIRSYIWYTILRFHGYDLSNSESLFNWSFAQLKRYIPGNIWGIVGVSLHFSEKKVSKKNLSTSFITESALVVLTTSLLSLLGLPLIISSLHLTNYEGLLKGLGAIVVITFTIIYMFSGSLTSRLKLPKAISYALPSFSVSKLIKLWSLMMTAFLCYGIGTYFAINSIVYIDPNKFWLYVGFFIFSLLLGFVSFITPTGLGVREGTMAIGLGSIMTSPLAAFSSIFTRLILIISELTFLAISFAFYRTKNLNIKKGYAWIQSHPHEVVLFLGFLAFSIYFIFISILRYQNFYTGRFDLGNMDQTVWNTVHGNIFQLTNPNGTNIVSRLSFHADFILVLLAPIYFLWQDPRTLLIVQTLVVGAGAFFIYLLAQSIIKNKNLSLILCFLYLLNPSLERTVIYDFHGVTLATTFLLGAFYFMYKRKYCWFILLSILAAITKEQIWAIIALFGLYIMIIQKRRFFGSIVFLVSTLITYLLLWKIIPWAAGAQHFALSYYSNGEGADSPTSLIEQFIFAPIKTINMLLQPDRVSYLTKLFFPLGFLAIFAPLILIFAAPDLTINLLSSKAELYQIYYQYTAAITPFLFIASIFGVAFILRRFRLINPFMIGIYLILVGIYSSYLYGPLPGSKEPNLDMITKINPSRNEISSLLSNIPSKYSVSTSNSLGSHLTHRQYLFTVPYGWDSADFIVFLKNESNAYPSIADHLSQINKLSTSSAYIKYFDDGNLVAFRKKSISLPNIN